MRQISDLRVADCMSSVLVSAMQSLSVADAAHTMASHGIRHLPVLDGKGRLVGIVSDRDVRLAAFRNPEEDDGAVVYAEAPVWQIMSTSVVTVSPTDTVAYAAELLRIHHIGALVVMRGGVPAGMLTTDDLLGVLVLNAHPPPPTQAYAPLRGGL